MSTEHPIRPIRRAGVPLAAFETTDPALTILATVRALNGKAAEFPLLQWDIVRGLSGMNDLGNKFAGKFEPTETQNPVECLSRLAGDMPGNSIVFFHNGHTVLADPIARQAVWNLRDIFKARGSLLVLLGPVFTLPAELKNDVVVISEPLPDLEEIKRIITSITADAGLPAQSEETVNKASDALLGLSAFAAEQCLAMGITKAGIDLVGLWERKRKMIEQTPGLKVWRGGETFADIGGCSNVKEFMRDIARGKRAPRAIAFVDEIEKSISGVGDTSGVSQDQLGALLTFMQDKAAAGVIFIGPPGAAKSAIAKATGNETNIPTIQVDLGAMKGSLVGQSEQQLRQALDVIDAVSQGQTLFIATCNSFGNLPPELKRRFTLGTFFFDLPSTEERATIWSLYQTRYSLGSQALPSDSGWTGAEIKQCCDVAYRLGRSLVEAAKFVVPVAVSAADKIDALRKQASGKFIDASRSGIYQHTPPAPAQATGRKFTE